MRISMAAMVREARKQSAKHDRENWSREYRGFTIQRFGKHYSVKGWQTLDTSEAAVIARVDRCLELRELLQQAS